MMKRLDGIPVNAVVIRRGCGGGPEQPKRQALGEGPRRRKEQAHILRRTSDEEKQHQRMLDRAATAKAARREQSARARERHQRWLRDQEVINASHLEAHLAADAAHTEAHALEAWEHEA